MSSPGRPSATAVWRHRAKLAAAALIGAFTVLFAVLNIDEVRVNWIFGTWTTPLIIVIVVSGLLGGAITLLIGRRSRGP